MLQQQRGLRYAVQSVLPAAALQGLPVSCRVVLRARNKQMSGTAFLVAYLLADGGKILSGLRRVCPLPRRRRPR